MEEICWDLWFVLESIEAMVKDSKVNCNNTKDNSKSCLFLCVEQLDQIKNRIADLDSI